MFLPLGTRKHLIPLSSSTQPSLIKPKFSKVAGTFSPETVLIIVSGWVSVLLRSFGLIIKSAPSVGAKFWELSTLKPVSYTHLDVYKRQTI